MTSAREALDRALALRGKTRVDLPPNTTMGKAVRRHGVMATPEFHRINSLPRRVWYEDEALVAETTELMTEYLRTPNGEQVLRPIQAVAIKEAADQGGIIGGLQPGDGKTIPSILIFTFVDAPRPVLFVPAKLREKTDCDLRELAVHWRVPEHLQILSYEDLSSVKWCDWLMRYRPSHIGGDEAHNWKHDDTARTMRLERFLESFPATPMYLWSGTFIRKELWDVQRLCDWALHEGSPVPRNWKDCSDWCNAMDPRAKTKLAPGALGQWCIGAEVKSIDGVKAAVGRRIAEAPGVIMSHGKSLITASLSIDARVVEFEECEPHMERLKTLGEKPDGWKVVDAPVRWQVEQMLALGFFLYLDPYPPPDWATARKEWASFCLEVIKDRSTEVDSELRVWMECERLEREGELIGIFDNWRREKSRPYPGFPNGFKENRKPEWFSNVQIERAAAWLERHKGLCWTPFPEFGERLSQVAKVPFYHHNGMDADGNSIVNAKRGPAVVSVYTCDEGLNLQDRWHENLYPCPMSDGSKWEQTLARTHRVGQSKDEVTALVWLSARVNYENMVNAIEAERGAAHLSQTATKKLCIADISVATPPAKSRAWRWK